MATPLLAGPKGTVALVPCRRAVWGVHCDAVENEGLRVEQDGVPEVCDYGSDFALPSPFGKNLPSGKSAVPEIKLFRDNLRGTVDKKLFPLSHSNSLTNLPLSRNYCHIDVEYKKILRNQSTQDFTKSWGEIRVSNP